MKDEIRKTIRCAVTGSGGYLGNRLASHLERIGVDVVRLSSRGSGPIPRFSLADGMPDGSFRQLGVDALVHCAWDFSLTKPAAIHDVNAGGSIKLFEQAVREGVSRLVFISSMSAFGGCRSQYGKSKLTVEKAVLGLSGTVIRPGLIYGEEPRGMVGSLLKIVDRSPVTPLIGNGNYVLYLVHEEDLATLVARHATSDTPTSGQPIIAAHEMGYKFREILTHFAELKGKRIHFMPVPWRLVWSTLALGESLSVPMPFRSDSLISLLNQDTSPDFAQTRSCGVDFRAFADYLQARRNGNSNAQTI
jgi:nucleoside-diphosphate-sugar epimerase